MKLTEFRKMYLPGLIWAAMCTAIYSAMGDFIVASGVLVGATVALTARSLSKMERGERVNLFTVGLLVLGVVLAIVVIATSLDARISILLLLGYGIFGFSVLPFARTA